MTTSPQSRGGTSLPGTLRAKVSGSVAVLSLARPGKRNALSDETILGIERFFQELDAQIRAVVLDADGWIETTRGDIGQTLNVTHMTIATQGLQQLGYVLPGNV